MSFTLGLLIALVLSGLAMAAVVWPLLKKGPAPVLVEDGRLAELLHRKEQVLASIKELEFDYRVGKMSEADYQQYDQRLRRQAISLMQQIEQVAPESAGFDATLEREIEQRRLVKPASTSKPEYDAGVEAEITRRRRVPATQTPTPTNGVAARFCTNCGATLAPHHKFCANCGIPVEQGEAAAAVETA
jgi:hypothetical protein